MIVKIGETVHTGNELPIMVIFNEKDKILLREALENPNWHGKYLKSPVNYFADKNAKIAYMDNVPPFKESIAYNNLIEE